MSGLKFNSVWVRKLGRRKNANMPSNKIPPLFNWLNQADVNELENQRRELRKRIFLLPKNSHKRLKLEALIMHITRRELEIEIGLQK